MPISDINLNDLSPLERAKIIVEYDRIKIDKWKAWGIAVPIIVACITVVYGMWGQNEQSKLDFEIKAAEIVMNSSSPVAAANKAEALKTLFPDRLPKNFAETFQDLYGGYNDAATK